MIVKKIALLFGFLLIIPFVFADEIELFVSGEINIEEESSDARIDYILSKFYFYPENSYRQEVLKLDTQPEAQQKVDHLVFRWENPKEDKLLYGVNSIVVTNNKFPEIKTKVKYPLESLGGYEEYTKPTELIDSEFPEIRKKALEIYDGSDDLFVVVSNLATWIHENIEYDWNYVANVKKASWVLTNKRGTCDEFSTLLIALSRELGIPARYVYGMAYADIPEFQGYGQHAWTEIYFPGYGWVPFDPSYNQLGYIDNSHIKLKEAIDPSKIRTEFEWKALNVNVVLSELDFNAKLRENSVSELPYSLKLNVVKKEVGFGSYNLIELEVKNLNDYYISEEFLLVGTEEVEIDDVNRRIVLKPNEIKNIYWIVKLEENLDKKLFYQFPFGLYSARNVSLDISFKSNYRNDVYNLEEIEDFENIIERGDEIPEKITFLQRIINWFNNLF